MTHDQAAIVPTIRQNSGLHVQRSSSCIHIAASAIWIIHHVLWWQKCHRIATPQTNTISQISLRPLYMSRHTQRLHRPAITVDIPRGYGDILHQRSSLSLFRDGTLCWSVPILPHLLYSINIINVPSSQTPTNHLAKLRWANQWCEAVEFSHYRHDSRWLVCLLVHQRSQPLGTSNLHLHKNFYRW